MTREQFEEVNDLIRLGRAHLSQLCEIIAELKKRGVTAIVSSDLKLEAKIKL